ncbi:RluA family pseudouridine synthase [Acidimicrobiia bacterium]|nr:RluA family pseudouridine synthase [Acidimicrobiia bacterium]MDB2532619.1 RluA family pseudouridine synthase [Candidatus Actinomarina sp.]MDA9846043.1 RluA family pseudouridine synthase [Acidimicrobiia bacterium]MDB0017297.1 RluA family pseudouridine synthase [Acidimicrobiia bacterium]MDB3980882.1 RluA family pseudouridine synthase [Acidimicrobiia bacterium]
MESPYCYFRSLKINNIKVVYEDDNFIIYNKPNGLLTHPTNKSTELTLRDHLVKEHPSILSWGEENREGIVHRLDRVTSGLIVCALNLESYNLLKSKFKNREIKKSYVALIEGALPSDSGILNLPLTRSLKNRSKRTVDTNGRNSITNYELINFYENLNISRIELDLITGRNHQIRAHMEYMKTPILNDTLYTASKNYIIPENSIALHSAVLKFTLDNKKYSFNSEEPSFFNQVLDV